MLRNNIKQCALAHMRQTQQVFVPFADIFKHVKERDSEITVDQVFWALRELAIHNQHIDEYEAVCTSRANRTIKRRLYVYHRNRDNVREEKKISIPKGDEGQIVRRREVHALHGGEEVVEYSLDGGETWWNCPYFREEHDHTECHDPAMRGERDDMQYADTEDRQDD